LCTREAYHEDPTNRLEGAQVANDEWNELARRPNVIGSADIIPEDRELNTNDRENEIEEEKA
jgi:hypothetical protein